MKSKYPAKIQSNKSAYSVGKFPYPSKFLCRIENVRLCKHPAWSGKQRRQKICSHNMVFSLYLQQTYPQAVLAIPST
jgi:hypothetical protein